MPPRLMPMLRRRTHSTSVVCCVRGGLSEETSSYEGYIGTLSGFGSVPGIPAGFLPGTSNLFKYRWCGVGLEVPAESCLFSMVSKLQVPPLKLSAACV